MKQVKLSFLQILLAFATLMAGALLINTNLAHAQSSYFTSRGCVNCHPAPVAATCAGCHQHSGTLTATKNKTTPYAPGETVTITLTASGARSGWIGVRLYDQSGAEIARSSGNQSGMGGATTYPAVLSAPAPAVAGDYNWRIAYFGNNNGTGTRDVHSEKSVNVAISVAAPADTTAPVVAAFTLPATSTSLTVPVSSLTATDNVAVSGYLVTTSATKPLATAAGWSATAPTSVAAPADGSVTFYAWAKDAAGNVSAARSAVVAVTTVDLTKPFVNLSTLSNGAITNNQVLNISGRAWDNVALDTVTCNGTRVYQYGDGSFSLVLPLLEGVNAVNFVAIDKAGNRATIARKITYQPLAPSVSITAPVDNLASAKEILDITGTVAANSTVTVTVNGKNPQVAALSGSVFNATVYLSPGINTIAVQVVDPAGSVSNAKRTVRYALNKPTLAITAPSQDVIVGAPTVVVQGAVTDNLSAVTTVKIAVAGQVFWPVVAVDGTFSQQLTLSKEQRYAIVVVATDASGKSVFTTRNVIYQATPAAP